MDLVRFYARNSQEVLGLLGQHVYLVAVATAIAIAVGVPLGIMLTRRAAWRPLVLGLANVFQTIPSLALFGFLIPLPLIGGIGDRKSTRLNSSHPSISYAVFCLKKKTGISAPSG